MTDAGPGLRRVLTFWPLLFYGLGVIVGAGIYVAIGTVMARAGDTAPVAFLLAGITAAMTGLCYAELASRFPEASGSVAYVKRGFGSEMLARLTGLAVTATVAISAASIAHGAIRYLGILLPWPPGVLLLALIVACVAVAAYGVGESVRIAAAIGVLEIGGFIAATIAGLLAAPELTSVRCCRSISPAGAARSPAPSSPSSPSPASRQWRTWRRRRRTLAAPCRSASLPRSRQASCSMCRWPQQRFLSDSVSDRPLLDIFAGAGVSVFATVGFLAVGNGTLVEIVMLARLF